MALSFNQLLRQRSRDARLLVSNLPLVNHMDTAEVREVWGVGVGVGVAYVHMIMLYV